MVKGLFDWAVHFGIREFFKMIIFEKKQQFLKNQNPHNFFVFQTTESIHTFLESSHQTGIMRGGQNSDIATRLFNRAPFSLYCGTHCSSVYILLYNIKNLLYWGTPLCWQPCRQHPNAGPYCNLRIRWP